MDMLCKQVDIVERLQKIHSARKDAAQAAVCQWLNILKTSTTPSCSGPIPAQKSFDKSQANSVLGDIFSHLMFEMNFYRFHRFSWEKIH